MTGTKGIRDRIILPPAILVSVSIFVMVVNADGGNNVYVNAQVSLCSAVVKSNGLRGQRQAQESGKERASDPECLHAGESINIHAHNLPSTLIAVDETALCLDLKNLGVRKWSDVAQQNEAEETFSVRWRKGSQ
jgi:hypothetical protein